MYSKKFFILIIFTIFTIFLNIPIYSNENLEWGYTRSTGSDNWSRIKKEYEQCKEGHHQSPVNIKSFTRHQSDDYNIKFYYKPSHEVILNDGHTVELLYNEGSYITFQGNQYKLIQFHFHTPSEHLVKGKHYPIEMHLVHYNEKNSSYLVIAVFFQRGIENQFLSEFIYDIPKRLDKRELDRNINVEDLLAEIKIESNLTNNAHNPLVTKINKLSQTINAEAKFWTYEGSLTTPPCTESVRRVVLQNPLSASAKQIYKLRQAESINARHTQKLYDREVEEFDNFI